MSMRRDLTTAILAAASIVYPAAANAQSGGNAQMAALVQSTISTSTEVGQYKGNTYYAKVAGPGIAQIFRVPTGNPTSYAMVGTVINGKPTISPSEAEGFNSLDKNKLNAAIGSNAVLASAPQQPAPTPVSYKAQQDAAGIAAEGTAVQKDASTVEVKLAQNGDVVDFNKGGKILIRTAAGAEKADLSYMGLVEGANAGDVAKHGLSRLGNIALLGVGKGGGGTLSGNNYTIDYYKEGGRNVRFNTENIPGRGGDVGGIAAETLAAFTVAKNASLLTTLPGENVLRNMAGVAPDANSSTTPH